MKRLTLLSGLVLAILTLVPGLAEASEALPHIPGAELSILWAVPFACMLLSIALGPLFFAHFWEHHFGKVAVFWGMAFLVPCAIVYGPSTAIYEGLHSIILEYIPFIILLFSLFTVAGGVRLKGSLVGTPAVNTGLLLTGTVLASWMGTTGAAMLLIRPLLRANAHRKYRVHQVVFFIFLVANIGGSLTPLGDPPLFLGYEGKVNLILLLGIVLAVLISGIVDLGELGSIMGIHISTSGTLRDVVLLIIAWLSWKLTSRESRELNGFTWGPILEVGKLFFGIFLSMIPAIAILRAGTDGALAGLINMVFHDGQPVNAAFFWLTGALSSFLDNAPTYVVFFNTAGGDPQTLMTTMADTLVAISAGAVFMGANTYIGNAPNFMVRSIAEERGVPMPSFFGYMMWSCGILVPLFIVVTFIFF